MELQKPITTKECEKAYYHLMRKGYFSEEHISGFYLDHRYRELIQVLHQMGYKGKLLPLGYYYPEYGAFYYIIDLERITTKKAKQIMDKYVANYVKKYHKE